MEGQIKRSKMIDVAGDKLEITDIVISVTSSDGRTTWTAPVPLMICQEMIKRSHRHDGIRNFTCLGVKETRLTVSNEESAVILRRNK